MEKDNLHISTTESVEGYRIVKHCGLIFANVVVGAGFFSDLAASARDFVGGRAKSYQRKMDDLYNGALEDLFAKAEAKRANAITGFRICASEMSGKGMSMMMLTAYGSAVVVEPDAAGRYNLLDKMLHMKQFLENGIVSQEEYDYEVARLKMECNNELAAAVAKKRAKEEQDKAIQEMLREQEERAERMKAIEEERRQEAIAKKEADNDIKSGTFPRLKAAIQEAIENGSLSLKNRIPIPEEASREPSNIQYLMDEIYVDMSQNMFEIICDYLMKGRVYEACAYYMKATASDDYGAAFEYIQGVKSVYERLDGNSRIDKIANRILDVYISDGPFQAEQFLKSYSVENKPVIESIIAVLS